VTRPRLLDLFCGAGGAAVGYHRAGFDVIGVDINPQPRYPFEFVQADAMTYQLDGFDAIHASPPCQAYSITKHSHGKRHPELLEPTIARLRGWGGPWVVENVVGAPMPNPVELCGASFGLTADDIDGAALVLRRHRLFSSNLVILGLPCMCAHYRRAGIRVGGVYGGGPSNRAISNRPIGTFRGGYTPTHPVRGRLMGIDWMAQKELCEAIPPAYTEHIGRQLLAHLEVSAA
jgi:DNA (cytosine-5)-methyltransferase 1